MSHERTKRARLLRRSMTGVELILWKALRMGKLRGFKFRRQDPIDDYVVDFSCPRARLIVEVDGPWHEGTIDSDVRRDARLRRLGYRVIRFTSDDVLEDVDWVVAEIEAVLAPLTGPPRRLRRHSPSEAGGESREGPRRVTACG